MASPLVKTKRELVVFTQSVCCKQLSKKPTFETNFTIIFFRKAAWIKEIKMMKVGMATTNGCVIHFVRQNLARLLVGDMYVEN